MRIPFWRGSGQQVDVVHSYDKGKIINLGVTPLGSGVAAQADLDVAGYTYLVLLSRIGNATTPAAALGDLGIAVVAYEDDGVTVFPAGVNAGLNVDFVMRAAGLSAPFAYVANRYLLFGLDRVSIRLTNNNAGALQGATSIFYLQR